MEASNSSVVVEMLTSVALILVDFEVMVVATCDVISINRNFFLEFVLRLKFNFYF